MNYEDYIIFTVGFFDIGVKFASIPPAEILVLKMGFSSSAPVSSSLFPALHFVCSLCSVINM